ncbi:PAAR domain-containing protein [Cupriavidus alkaliphilus]|uniref:PAAR domain-containing protein n=1 Tax=Cupriavidus alkaliphilus TaxID=942866 RepID=UPI000B864BF3|nr:PAAR domain-containing protein [Cupriavidus alkaliphilus]
MISGLICVGDRTTHGGTVITGDATSIIGNRAMARAGDMTICPKCKGTFPILAGNGIITAPNGVPYARHMDRTACGARLLASQDTTLASDMETPVAADFEPAGIAAVTASGLCLDCLMKAAMAGAATVVRG